MSEQNDDNLAKLREKADKATKLERENAFLKAGIDPESPKAKYFVKAYDGDLTKDAIIAEATEAGIIGAPEPPKEDPAPEGGRREATEDEQTFDQMAEIGSESAEPGGQPEVDELTVGWEKFADRRKSGARLEDAAAEVITRIVGEAVNGDQRFLVK